MYTTRPPSYTAPYDSFSRTPSYSAEPRPHEQRLALNARVASQPAANFLKSSKNGDIKLRLVQEDDNLDLPVYGSGAVVAGLVELTRTENISSVEVKVEGHLQLKENGEGGQTHHTLCLDKVSLWIKNTNHRVCPSFLRFARTLPTSFEYEGRSYPLPPSHSVQLKGLPGFCATIDYSVSAITHIGNTTVSTPFIYCLRSRPALPIPSPLLCAQAEGGFIERAEWKVYRSILKANAKAGLQNIDVKFYLPASRIFCASQGVPFHITFESDANSLAAFLPYGPSGKLGATRIRLMRHSAVDARRATTEGAKGGIWRVDYIGETALSISHASATHMSFTGRINLVDPTLKVMGFSVPGLSVQDCILLTVAPAEGSTSTKAPPFAGIREVIPVRLTTDAWTEDGRGIAVARRSLSVSPSRAI
ncbi:hypothetical protein MVEN_00773400 [Mycena venus]|uniref:Uncharacterized protein n=1 Tax=Mycena venus TaxID=2733690 RepID=A0A8H7D5U9_9AGAR|nr:hypothetical protein MVEN_00773400 [Mycena venus]